MNNLKAARPEDYARIKTDRYLSADAKRVMIMSDIAKGLRYSELLDKYVAEWGLSPKTVQMYIIEATEYLRSDACKQNLIAMNNERLDGIITESIKDGDRKSAIRAIDVQNKLNGGYTEKVQIEGDTDITLKFDF